MKAFLDKVVWKEIFLPPDAARKYYDQHEAELAGKSFETLKPVIERSLLDDLRQQAQRGYLLELKKTAVILRGPLPTPGADGGADQARPVGTVVVAALVTAARAVRRAAGCG